VTPGKTKYVLDTNLYVFAARDPRWKGAVREFMDRHMPWMYLHSTVAGELLAGALTAKLERDTQRNLIQPFESVGRVITPSEGAWKRSGLAIARLVREGKLSPGGVPRSFFNDCLIAASARDEGVTVVTHNEKDFDLIGSVMAVDFVSPWPEEAIAS